jgi:hypothetical protein
MNNMQLYWRRYYYFSYYYFPGRGRVSTFKRI